MATYTPQSGTEGSAIIAGNTLAMDHWEWHGSANVMDAASFTGGDWMEYSVGKKRGRFTISGTWNKDFNPNSNTIKIGATVSVLLRLSGSTSAACNTSIVEDIDVTDDADGKADVTISLIGNYTFSDFSGGNA